MLLYSKTLAGRPATKQAEVVKMNSGNLLALFLFISVFSVLVLALTTNTTVMTWNVPASRSHTIAYGGSCTSSLFYFNEFNGEDPDSDRNTARIIPSSGVNTTDANCQSSSVAAMTITNNGNITADIDANFQTLFAGADLNLELKVWMGTGAGCGTGGFGGWQKNCTILGANPVTQSACRDYNSSNGTTDAILVNNLAINDTNQLCFSGEMTCGNDYQYTNCVAQGSTAYNFDTNASPQ